MEEQVLSFSVHGVAGKPPNSKKTPKRCPFGVRVAGYFIMSSSSSMDWASMIISFAVKFLEAIM